MVAGGCLHLTAGAKSTPASHARGRDVSLPPGRALPQNAPMPRRGRSRALLLPCLLAVALVSPPPLPAQVAPARVRVERFRVTEATRFPAGELEALVRSGEGRELTLA